MDCASARYAWMQVFASCMVIIYPIGAPLLLIVMLFKHRAILNPPNKEEHEVIKARKEDPVLANEPVTGFSMLYRPSESRESGALVLPALLLPAPNRRALGRSTPPHICHRCTPLPRRVLGL